MKKRLLSGLPGAALALCLCVTLLAALLYVCGTFAPLMEMMIRRFAPTEYTLLPDAHYRPMVEMITGYLRGTVPEFQYTLQSGDLSVLAFHDYEQLHMADCLSLFRLCWRILLGGAAASAVLGVIVLRMKDRKPALRGCCITTVVLLGLIAIVGVAAAIDFNSVFVLFHQLSFSNSMWLLDPRTDLLIRLMPLDFFIHYVMIIGGVWIAGMLTMLIVSWRIGFHK